MSKKPKIEGRVKFKTLTVNLLPIEIHHEFTMALKDSNMSRAQYLELMFNKAHMYDKEVAIKNKMLDDLGEINSGLTRAMKKMVFVMQKKFGIIITDNETVLDGIISEIEKTGMKFE